MGFLYLCFLLYGLVASVSPTLASAGRPSFLSKLFRRETYGGMPKKRDGFEIMDEKLVYSGWRTIIQRQIKMRNGKIVEFDVRTTSHEVCPHDSCQ